MIDRPPQRDSADEPVHRAESPGRPRWLTVVAIVAGVLVLLLFIALHLSGALGPGAH